MFTIFSVLTFEHRSAPLLPRAQFVVRLLKNGAVTLSILSCALLIGVLGYRFLGELAWLDSVVNASMILSGMGPVDPITAVGGKWFESAYALFSGVVFATSLGIFLAPALHRVLHKLHLEAAEGEA